MDFNEWAGARYNPYMYSCWILAGNRLAGVAQEIDEHQTQPECIATCREGQCRRIPPDWDMAGDVPTCAFPKHCPHHGVNHHRLQFNLVRRWVCGKITQVSDDLGHRQNAGPDPREHPLGMRRIDFTTELTQ